jgi:hypothetical protein
MKVKGLGRAFWVSDRSGGRSCGAEIASFGLGSARRDEVAAVFARICAVMIAAGVVGAIVTG